MTTTGADLYYDPYDFEIDTDPYPVWKRLRDEQPLYWNDRYRLLRPQPVRGRRAVLGRLADLQLGQGHAPRAHPERDGDPTRAPSSSRTPRTTTCTAACCRGFSRRRRWRPSSPRSASSARAASTRWWGPVASTSSPISGPRCRCAPSACCSASPNRTRKRSATRSTRDSGSPTERHRTCRSGCPTGSNSRSSRSTSTGALSTRPTT